MMAHFGILVALALAWEAGDATSAGLPDPERQAVGASTSSGGTGRDRRAEHVRVRAAIDEVLARREFAGLHADHLGLRRKVMEWVEAAMQRVGSVFHGMPGWLLGTVLIWMLLALLAILAHLIYTLVMLVGGGSRASGGKSAPLARPGELLGIRDLDFDAVYAQARRLLTAGDWAAAVRYLYVASILWLDRQGAIVFQASKTNRDYVEELVSRDSLQEPFRRLTGCFESIVYGGAPPTRSLSQEMAQTVEGLLGENADLVAG